MSTNDKPVFCDKCDSKLTNPYLDHVCPTQFHFTSNCIECNTQISASETVDPKKQRNLYALCPNCKRYMRQTHVEVSAK